MSRCFPFPPPGYERKPTLDEPDLLKKEKRREKKHKKDKKDKEKKDSKEKREKDRSEGKHKEKKDKHREKKKDKEKTKTSIPDENIIYGQFEGYNGEILHNNEQDGEKNGSTGNKKPSIQFSHQNGDLLRNRNKVGDTENIKFVQELDRRIRNEEKGTGSLQFAVEGRKNSVNQVEIQKTDRRQVVTDGAGFGNNVVASRINGATPPLDNRRIEKMKEKGSDGRQVVMDAAGFGGNVAVPNRINGVTPPPLDRRIEKMQEKANDDKRKNKDRDKQKEGKDKEMEKEKKLKEKSERKKARMDNRHIMKNDSVDVVYSLSAYPLENSFQGIGNEGNLRKRKAMETNGVSHENEPRPNKMARPVPNVSPENGRKLDFFQNPSPSLLDKQGTFHGTSLNSYNVGSKGGQRVNGMITSQPVSVSAKKPSIPASNHVPSKPSPIKSPPVITNHVAAQSPPTTKPQLNHIAAQPPTSKLPPSIPKPIAGQYQLPPLSPPPPPPPPPPQPPTTSGKQPMSQPKPPPTVVNKVAPPPPPLPIPKKKHPHPDTKYLTQILSVPKLDQWCGLDDQEWLFSSKAGPTSKKPPIIEPEVQVWSEAKHIESVDVCALPYVIPY